MAVVRRTTVSFASHDRHRVCPETFDLAAIERTRLRNRTLPGELVRAVLSSALRATLRRSFRIGPDLRNRRASPAKIPGPTGRINFLQTGPWREWQGLLFVLPG